MAQAARPDNDRLLRALAREPVDRTPVWLMRQAGRYLPEYREVREQAGSFMDLCRSPELAARVTLQPLERFDLDAAIVFSDILTIPDAMGLGLYFEPGEGPRFTAPVRTPADVAALRPPDVGTQLDYVMQALTASRHALAGRVPLIGFTGSPWTLATYMVEGGSSKTFARSKGLLYDAPDTAHQLLSLLADAVAEYLQAQIEAGAQALMVFDTWGGVLDEPRYRAFSLRYMARIVERLRGPDQGMDVPIVLFTKGGGPWLEAIAESGCDGVGLDWTTSLEEGRRRVGHRVALQGNLDPCALYASPSVIRDEVARCLADFGTGPGHVFNLGHGVHPEIPPEHVSAMVEAVHELSPAYHGSASDTF